MSFAVVDGQKYRIGDLLLKDGIITQEQLEKALELQKDLSEYAPLGEVCIELGFFGHQDLRRLLKHYQKQIYLGELILNLGLINEKQLHKALEMQKTERGKLGKILIQNGFINEENLVEALSVQLGIPWIKLSMEMVDQTIMKDMREEKFRSHEFVPIISEGDVLTVALTDPLDYHNIDQITSMMGKEIDASISTTDEILSIINQVYSNRDKDSSKNLIIGKQDLSKRSDDNVVELVNYIICNALTDRASDIHIEPQENTLRVRYRVDGIIVHKTDLPISIANSLLSRIKVLCGLDISERRRHQDGRIQAKIFDQEVDLRVSSYAAIWGENIVIRLLHRQAQSISIESMGMNPVVKKKFINILNHPSGVVLTTGPTGSGKTTTLYSALNYLNNKDRSIITVEDPVEYTLDGVVQAKLDPKLELTYMDFLKSMMRQDPDVIMVGEVRDSVGAEATIQAALTGHKVFSTFHTDDSTSAILRLMDMGINTFLISSTLEAVIAQRLVRQLCDHCKTPYFPSPELLNEFNITHVDPNRHTFYKPVGCIQCNHTGFRGRTAIHEVLIMIDAVREAILEHKSANQIRTVARKDGQMLSMREDGFYKAMRGITTLEEIIRVVFANESDMQQKRSADELVELCEEEDISVFTLGDPQKGEAKSRLSRIRKNAGADKLAESMGISRLEGKTFRFPISYDPPPLGNVCNIINEKLTSEGYTCRATDKDIQQLLNSLEIPLIKQSENENKVLEIKIFPSDFNNFFQISVVNMENKSA